MKNSIRRASTHTAPRRTRCEFAVWITGLPASGKSTLARALRTQLERRLVPVAVLESDDIRATLAPHAAYDSSSREAFYALLVYMGRRLIENGITVIFDATANLRAYRDPARRKIPRFLEIYVDTPLETCMRRDPKGIYSRARESVAREVPGLQAPYEPPENPDIVVHSESETPSRAAQRVIGLLEAKGYMKTRPSG